MFLILSCSCLCPICRNQVLSQEWRCSWSSAGRWCSNYIWVRGCHEIWEALILRTSNMASALVRNQMCTCPRLLKLICVIIIWSSIGRVSSDSHLSDMAKIVFRTIGRPFRRPLWVINKFIERSTSLLHIKVWLILEVWQWWALDWPIHRWFLTWPGTQ